MPDTQLPDGMTCTFNIYLTSDVSGLETVVRIEDAPSIPGDATKFEVSVSDTVTSVNGHLDEAGFRPMTRPEIADYLSRQ